MRALNEISFGVKNLMSDEISVTILAVTMATVRICDE
jgi:hypothetical protein